MLKVAVSAQAGRGTLEREIFIKDPVGTQEKNCLKGKKMANVLGRALESLWKWWP
jgi:hypothetical protein